MPTLVGSFKITDDCGCCGGSNPYLIVGDCESYTGTATLCGFSGYDDGSYDGLNPGNWEGQYRKWGSRTLAGQLNVDSYAEADCAGDAICFIPASFPFPAAGSTEADYAGTVELDCEGRTDPNPGRTFTSYDAACTPTETDEAASRVVPPQDDPAFTITKTLTTKTFTGQGCLPDTRPFTQRASYRADGEASETLSGERYLYDALGALATGGAEDVVAGTSCCASLTDGDLTTPEGEGPISLTGTAVRVPLTIFGCEPLGAIFNVYVTLQQGESTFVVSIGVPCQIPSFFYVPLGAPGADPICFVSASLTSP